MKKILNQMKKTTNKPADIRPKNKIPKVIDKTINMKTTILTTVLIILAIWLLAFQLQQAKRNASRIALCSSGYVDMWHGEDYRCVKIK